MHPILFVCIVISVLFLKIRGFFFSGLVYEFFPRIYHDFDVNCIVLWLRDVYFVSFYQALHLEDASKIQLSRLHNYQISPSTLLIKIQTICTSSTFLALGAWQSIFMLPLCRYIYICTLDVLLNVFIRISSFVDSDK